MAYVVAMLMAGMLVPLFYFVPIGLWVAASSSGAPVRIGSLIGMRLRRVPPAAVVRPYIAARKAGVSVELDELEAIYLAGADPGRVVESVIASHASNNGDGPTLSVAEAASRALAGEASSVDALRRAWNDASEDERAALRREIES